MHPWKIPLKRKFTLNVLETLAYQVGSLNVKSSMHSCQNKWWLYTSLKPVIPNMTWRFHWFWFFSEWHHVWKILGIYITLVATKEVVKQRWMQEILVVTARIAETSALAFLMCCSAYIYCINFIMIMHTQSNLCNMTIFMRPCSDAR